MCVCVKCRVSTDCCSVYLTTIYQQNMQGQEGWAQALVARAVVLDVGGRLRGVEVRLLLHRCVDSMILVGGFCLGYRHRRGLAPTSICFVPTLWFQRNNRPTPPITGT